MDFNLPEELKMVQSLARDFVKDQLIPLEKEVLGRESDLEGAKRNIPADIEIKLIETARQIGLWGLNIPEEMGGAGLGVLGACLVEEELSRTVLPFRLGDVSPVLFDCNEEQKKEYLLPLIQGNKSVFFALLEPGGGIDPASLEMKAIKADGEYILNGRKIVFSPLNTADFAVVFAVTNSEKGLRNGTTCFLVDCHSGGCSISPAPESSGWKAQVGLPLILTFKDTHVPSTAILGREGKAFNLGGRYLESRRIIRGARCVGAAARLLQKATEYASSWTSFGRTATGWPAVQALLAEMAVDIQSARLLVYQAAWNADEGKNIRIAGAMVKVFSTEMLKRVADKAVMVESGPGPFQGLPLEYLCRSLLVRNITEQALEVQKSLITAELLKTGAVNFNN